MRKISRRELARMIAVLPVMHSVPPPELQTAQPSTYTGPLTGVANGIEGRRFDPVAYAHDLYAAAPRRLAFKARTRPEAEAWQKTLRARLIELIGGFPAERQPL